MPKKGIHPIIVHSTERKNKHDDGSVNVFLSFKVVKMKIKIKNQKQKEKKKKTAQMTHIKCADSSA